MLIKINDKANKKLEYYIKNCEQEVSGFGKIEIINNKEIKIIDLLILEQKISDISAEIEANIMARFLTELLKKKENPKDWTLWWHSHADMNAFFSPTDTDTIEKSSRMPYLVSIVSNKNKDIEARIDIFKPFRYTEEAKIIIESPHDQILEQKCIKEIKKLTTEKEETTRTYIPSSYNLDYNLNHKKKKKKKKKWYHSKQWQKKTKTFYGRQQGCTLENKNLDYIKPIHSEPVDY